MVAADFTEEEVFTEVVEDFTEAGSGAEDFTAGAGFAAVGSEAVGFAVEVVSAAEVSGAAARFAGDSALAEELSEAASVEAVAAIASGAVSVSVDEALDGEAGVGA